MNRPLATLAFVTSFVSACTAISGLDADYELAPSVASDAADDALVNPRDGGPSDSSVVPPDGPDAMRCTSGPCPVLCGGSPCTSCLAVKTANATSASGIYVVQGTGGALPVYCDMEVDNGGWTLIGRSSTNGVGTSATAFGWHSETGSLDDDSKPYSLGVQRLAFEPTQMVFGANAAGKKWGANAYRANLPTNFANGRMNSAIAITPLSAVKGDCQSGGAMQSYAGYTSRTNVFFFRDNDSDSEVFGLFDNRWFANVGTSCPYAGQLNGLQGMIFIR